MTIDLFLFSNCFLKIMQKVFRVNLTKIRDMVEIFTIFALIANLGEGLLKLGTKGPHPSSLRRN